MGLVSIPGTNSLNEFKPAYENGTDLVKLLTIKKTLSNKEVYILKRVKLAAALAMCMTVISVLSGCSSPTVPGETTLTSAGGTTALSVSFAESLNSNYFYNRNLIGPEKL